MFANLRRRHFRTLLHCVLHYMSDVRESASALLAPFKVARGEVAELTSAAVRSLCSPKYAECESGAALLKLCVGWAQRVSCLELCHKSVGSENHSKGFGCILSILKSHKYMYVHHNNIGYMRCLISSFYVS